MLRNINKKVICSILFILAIAMTLFPAVVKAQNDVQIYIDYPTQNQICKDELYVHGWFMSPVQNKTLKVYIDNDEKEITSELKRYNRPDVTGSVIGYGTPEQNPLAGYTGTIKIDDIADGVHTLIVRVINNETGNIIGTVSTTFNVQKYKTLLNIDYPKPVATTNSTLYVHGWVMSDLKDKDVKIYIDNSTEEAQSDVQRYNRPDVLQAIKDYGTEEQNPLAGYKGNVYLGNDILDGRHTITVKVINPTTNEIMAQETREFFVQKYKVALNIDYPKQNETSKSSLYVHGWLMSDLKDKDVKIYIDGSKTEAQSDIQRYNRPDVLQAIKDYGTKEQNPLAGYKGNVYLGSDMLDGKHTVTVKVINPETNEVMAEDSRDFWLKKYETALNIDYPRANETTGKTVYVHGWLMSEQPNKTVKIYIDNDNNEVTSSIERYNRPDVLQAVKGYGTEEQNPLAGYKGTVDISNIKDGRHEVIVKVIDTETNELMQTEKRTFYVDKYKTQICIDYPYTYTNYRNTLPVHGWVMSDEANKSVRFYLNGNDITSQISLYNRPDVINAVTGYGTQQENPTPGFDGKIDISGYSTGDYTLKVEVYSNTTQEVIKTQEIRVQLNKFTYEEGTYGISGLKVQNGSNGNDLKYYRIGDGNNVMFATFSVHGFEDLWYRDGAELSYIAEQFKSELYNNQWNYRDVLNNWTIYIFPCANPDGQYSGWTNNGPGRTTLYSAAPGNKGVDMNRSWSVGYTRKTSDREYNGTEPFQSYETRYLRDFILSRKSSSGNNILVDLHGWLNETIGDDGLGSYYRYHIGMNTHISSYGGGYLINWARSLGNTRSVLVELPEVSGHNEVANRDFAGKYTRATIDMLRNN